MKLVKAVFCKLINPTPDQAEALKTTMQAFAKEFFSYLSQSSEASPRFQP